MDGQGRRVRAAVVLASLLFCAAALPGLAHATNAPERPSPLELSLSGPRLLVLPVGHPGSPDSMGASQPAVFRASNGSYLMYYTASNGFRDEILGAISPDGIAWAKLPGGIFLNDGAGSPFVLPVGTGYRMWFESVVWGPGPLGYTDRIYGATSMDGLSWTITGMVLDVGSGSDWDAGSVGDPWVVQGTDGVSRMYYSMYAANQSVALGVATSTDLLSFTKWSGNPVFLPGPSGSWDDVSVSNPSVVAGATWTLFYQGRRSSTTGQLGIAASSDGYRWTRAPAPFLASDAPGTWDSYGIGSPAFQQAEPARLYYNGGTQNGVVQVGMVNITGAPSSGTGGAVLGLSLDEFVFLIAILGVGAAVLVAIAVTLRNQTRPRG